MRTDPIVILAILCYLIIFTAITHAQSWQHVQWVSDGDTIVLKNGQHIRYIGINAPEIDHETQKAEPNGYTARSLNEHLVAFKRIRLEFGSERYDRYGRLLAYVFLPNDYFVNAGMLENGLAFYLGQGQQLKYETILLSAQRRAMAAQKGMWHHWQERGAKYVGNQSSRRFHMASCAFAKKIKKENRVHFSKKWDAFWAGYAPATQCIQQYWSDTVNAETR